MQKQTFVAKICKKVVYLIPFLLADYLLLYSLIGNFCSLGKFTSINIKSKISFYQMLQVWMNEIECNMVFLSAFFSNYT